MTNNLNRGLSPQTLLICDLWETGMNYAEIAAKIGKSKQVVGQSIYRARLAGVRLRPMISKAETTNGLINTYQVQFGNVGSAIKNLPRPVLHWLLKNTPAGMTVAEYMVTFVLDAYHEEKQQ